MVYLARRTSLLLLHVLFSGFHTRCKLCGCLFLNLEFLWCACPMLDIEDTTAHLLGECGELVLREEEDLGLAKLLGMRGFDPMRPL